MSWLQVIGLAAAFVVALGLTLLAAEALVKRRR